MLSLQKYLMVAGVAVTTALAIIPGQSVRAEVNPRVDALAQAENSSAMTRVKRWTRTSFEAAKKNRAQDPAKFHECSRKLDETKKKSSRRMSYHRQGHFLETCMKE